MHKRLETIAGTKAGGARLPVLMIVHQYRSSPGHVGNWFRMNGYPLDIRRSRFGDPLPETLENHAGAVIFGGPQSANDTDGFIRREVEWTEVPLKENKPFLGICLGAQMLALQLGGEVAAHPDGLAEIGYYPLEPTPEGAAMMDWPAHVYQWHREGFCAPQGAELLATGEHFAHQAFRYGSAYGLQFHPEISQLLVNRWVTRSGYRCVLPGTRPAPTHTRDHVRYGPAQRRWLDTFLRHWAGARADIALNR